MTSKAESHVALSDRRFKLDAPTKGRMIAAVANRLVAHADELTRLDSAIGDGNQRHNMTRGFEAVIEDLDALTQQSLPDFLRRIGMSLVAKVGGRNKALSRFGGFEALHRSFASSKRPMRVLRSIVGAKALLVQSGRVDVSAFP